MTQSNNGKNNNDNNNTKKKKVDIGFVYKSIGTVVYNIIILNMLLVLTLIPIITFGAGLAASFRLLKEMHSKEGNDAIVGSFVRHFKTLFFKATIIWTCIVLSISSLFLILPVVGELSFFVLILLSLYTILLILFAESYFKILGYSDVDTGLFTVMEEAMIRGLVRLPFTILSFIIFLILIFLGFSTGFLLFIFLGTYVYISFFIYPPPKR